MASSFYIFYGDFGKKLSNSVIATNFIMVEANATKGRGGERVSPYLNIFKKPILNSVKEMETMQERLNIISSI